MGMSSLSYSYIAIFSGSRTKRTDASSIPYREISSALKALRKTSSLAFSGAPIPIWRARAPMILARSKRVCGLIGLTMKDTSCTIRATYPTCTPFLNPAQPKSTYSCSKSLGFCLISRINSRVAGRINNAKRTVNITIVDVFTGFETSASPIPPSGK